MGDWKPQVVKITNVTKHFNADALDIVYTSAGDYPIIGKLNEYTVGDLAVFIPIDTIVPSTEQFFFLCPKHEGSNIPKYEVGSVPERYRRIKAKKIRAQYSQGMLIPFPLYINGEQVSPTQLMHAGVSEEEIMALDVVEILGLTKWEEQEEENLFNEKIKKHVQNEHAPKGWNIPYYDISSVRKYNHLFLPDEEIVLLEKDHGCNFSACFDGDRLWVKSRNNFKRTEISFTDGEGIHHIIPATDLWNEAARANKLAEKLRTFPMKVFFAECVGAVKGFRYDAEIIDGRLVPALHFFDVYDSIVDRYLDYDESLAMILSLGLTPSKELYRGVWKEKEEMYALAEGKSAWNNKHIREGWVMKSTKERFDPKLGSRFQLKLVSETYNIQK